MSKFSDKFIDGMSLVAEKVDENKFLGAIKDSFTIYMPFVIVGSFMSLFNTILCSTTTGLAKWIPALEALKPIFTAANFATLSCMTLPIVFLIGLKLGKKNNVPEHMLILGMLIAEMDLKKLMSYHRLWWITLLRLVGIPLIGIVLLKYSGLAALVPEGRTILLVTLLAICTPSASTLTQMAQVYGKDADYASAINVVTTLLCIVTMPLMVALYQM